MIAIASDHTALLYKKELLDFLRTLGHEAEDLGPLTSEPSDYPVYAEKVALSVTSGRAQKGILLCGTGIGMSIAAGKIRGVRCACCSELYSAILSRKHNDANILCLGARVIGIEPAKMIVQAWLETPFEGQRHARRLQMIEELEARGL